MNRKSNHQNLLRRVLALAVVMITMFALPTGAWAQDPVIDQGGQGGQGGGGEIGEIGEGGQGQTDNCTLSFLPNCDNVDGVTFPITKAKGSEFTIPECSFKRRNHIFLGWATSEEGNAVYQPRNIIKLSADLTLYAKWRHISIVTFYANGGTGTMDPVTMDYESQYTIPECTFYNGGMPFAGWATSAKGTVMYQPGDKITLTDNLTLYAKWITEVTIDGLNYKITSLNPFTVKLTGYEGDKPTGVLNIPASVKIGENNYSVTSISALAFYETSITLLIIPDAITTIGEKAFAGCGSLTSVILGSGVTSTEDVFTGCRILESFTVDENNTIFKSMDGVLFNKAGTTLIQYPRAKNDKSYTIPDGVTSIGDNAFEGNYILTSVIIGNDVTSIGNYAFEECHSLTSVTIGNGVTSIGYNAFDNCYALKSLIIGNGVTTIGDYAFHACGALTSVIFGNSVTSIGPSAFQACSSLTSVNIPASVTTIGYWAFLGCTRLTSVTINATSLTTYGKDAFKTNLSGNASGLKIYVPAGSEDTYRAGWSEYAEVIEAIPEADATKYAITTDDYCEVYDANMWSENTPLSEATAGMDLEISLKEGAQPASGKYFSGEYTVNGVSLGANEWEEFNSGFTMPAQAVTVAALQADRTVLTFDFSTAGPQEMTKAAIQLFNGDERLEGKRIRNEGDDGELIDFDGSGTPDMKRYFDATEDHCYVERLATADYTGSYSLTYEGPSDCYSAITFVFPSQSQQPLPTMDVSVTFTETTYDGKTHALNVSVPDGATITYADKQDGTYSDTAPTFKDVVNTTIYYKVTKEGCQDATGTVAVKINKKVLTVTAEDKSMTAGGTEPALTYKTDGLVEGDKITVVLQRAEGNTVGTYDITLKSISGVDNYEVTFVKGVFTIKQPVINNNDPLGNLNGKELFALLDELKPIINQIAPGLNIALTADANGRLSVTVNGMTFSIGDDLILVLRNVKKEDILTPAFQGKVMAYLSKLVNGNAGTRGSGDMVETELVSGEEFVIPDDGDLVLILKTEEAPVTITALTVTSKPDDSGDNKDDNKNDINGDGVVNAIDLVKAISDGKTQAEIDAIVDIIMGRK